MISFEEVKAILREKSGKKLVVFSTTVFLLITVIVFFAVFELRGNVLLNLMDEYLGEIPKIIDGREDELRMHGRVYEEDILARAELGLKLYAEENGLTDAEKLERVRGAVSAASVSLLDGQRYLLSTTGPASPEEIFRACVQTLEPHLPHPELYKDGGKGFVLLPIPGNTTRSLVFEFPCDTMLELHNALADWTSVLKRMLSGADFAAFAKTGDRLTGYPLDGLTPEETSRLYGDLTKVFQNADSFRSAENGRSSRIITLLGSHYLAARMSYPRGNTDILLTTPLKRVVGNFIYTAAAISAIIGWGIVLLQIYIFRRLLREKEQRDEDAVSRKWVCRATWPGILVTLAVTVLFSDMLLLLETRTDSTFIAMTKRMDLQDEIDFRKGQEKTLRGSFVDVYRSRAQMLAAFLEDHPDYQTRAGLKELNRIARADYLMRFDRTGQERFSSNSYTGFSIGEGLSAEYRAVLMGYPDAVVGPVADPYTGRMQIGAAILMTDREGQPDGFLLAVYSAGELSSELKRMSYENAVLGFAVRKGHVAAAISDENGRFIAHTDRKMIGLKAKDFLEDVEPGSVFEGVTDYKGESVYVSASAADGRTLLFMTPERGDFHIQANFILASLAALLILTLLYYPTAGLLIARAMARTKPRTSDGEESPMAVFVNGYTVFLTLFAIVALIATRNGWWKAFDYVFSGQWVNGAHLYFLWTALFVLSVTLCCEFLIRAALDCLESRLSLRTRSIVRLANSLIAYAANIFLLFFVLDLLGVNTTALLASAGIISIAVGLGAKSMASDMLAGFFMMMEGSLHVGDNVSIIISRGSEIKGRVTDVGIRTLQLTDEEGTVVTLGNSQILCVRNMSRNHAPQEPDGPAGEPDKNKV